MTVVFGVTGWKNTGKTTLVERLVAHLTRGGLKVSTIKRAHHAFDIDQPGRDSFRHRAAGAQEVLIAGGDRWALMHELRGAGEPALDDLLAKMTPVDLVLIEGWKREAHPKLECYRAEAGHPLRGTEDPATVAIAADCDVAVELPVPALNDTRAIADFIAREVGL